MVCLSEKQQEAVDHGEGALLVTGGPGSGKTRVLVERVKKLVRSLRRGKVLALAYGSWAADQIRDGLLEDASLGEAVDRVKVGTIHSFCWEIVQTRGHVIGLPSDVAWLGNDNDRLAMLKQVFLDSPELRGVLAAERDKDSYLHEVLNEIGMRKRRLFCPEEGDGDPAFARIHKDYNQKLRERAAIDSDDILVFAYRILQDNPGLVHVYNSIYRYVCIDEAQDLDAAQYAVVKVLCGKDFRNMMLAGDPGQSIYSLNGSSGDFMSRRFVADFDPVVVSLTENYGSANRIIEYSRMVCPGIDAPRCFHEGEVGVERSDDAEQEAVRVAERIRRLMETGHRDIEGRPTYDAFAVIARNRHVFQEVESELQKRRMPCYLKTDSLALHNESEVMDVFELAMGVMVNPGDCLLFNQLRRILGVSDSGQDLGQPSPARLRELVADSRFRGILPAVEELTAEGFDFRKALSRLSDFADAIQDAEERFLVVMDIREWQRRWQGYCGAVAAGDRDPASFRNRISLGKTQAKNAERGVALLTGRMPKGLRYDVVFMIGLCDGVFPDHRALASGAEAVEQEKENFYVAMTRARRLLYMSYPGSRRMPWGEIRRQEPSRFLKCFPEFR